LLSSLFSISVGVCGFGGIALLLGPVDSVLGLPVIELHRSDQSELRGRDFGFCMSFGDILSFVSIVVSGLVVLVAFLARSFSSAPPVFCGLVWGCFWLAFVATALSSGARRLCFVTREGSLS